MTPLTLPPPATTGPAIDPTDLQIHLCEYRDGYQLRRVVAAHHLRGALLVIDETDRGEDRRLVGRLDPDEPAGNEALLAELYVADPHRHARLLTDDDWFAGEHIDNQSPPDPVGLMLPDGRRVSLGVCDGELRWHHAGQPLSLRRVVAALESYEPVALTERALADRPAGVSGRVLRQELARHRDSPFVLNRGLRELLTLRLAQGDTLALIARRCGRVHHSGHPDTSWLARRCGLMAPPGEAHPTAWVHTDVLALIARQGLGVAPREVELA